MPENVREYYIVLSAIVMHTCMYVDIAFSMLTETYKLNLLQNKMVKGLEEDFHFCVIKLMNKIIIIWFLLVPIQI